MILHDVELLKDWLVPKLQPICDADPRSLADYIIALVRKDMPVRVLRELCLEELQVFLTRNTTFLVDTLFEAIENDLYMTGNRIHDFEKERSHASIRLGDKQKNRTDFDFHRPKRVKESQLSSNKRVSPAILPQNTLKLRRNAIENKKRLNNDEEIDTMMTEALPRTQTIDHVSNIHSGDFAGLKVGRCNNFEEQGYCLLGESCPHDHGSDPVVLEPAYNPAPIQLPMPVVSILSHPILTLNSANPSLSLIASPVTQTPTAVHPPCSVGSRSLSITDGYNPENPAYEAEGDPSNTLPVSGAHGIPPPSDLDTRKPKQTHVNRTEMKITSTKRDSLCSPLSPLTNNNITVCNSKYSSYSHKLGFPGISTKNTSTLSSALILRKIPSEMNTVAKLSSYFEKFGTVVNVQVRYDNDPEGALVRFTKPQEAKNAHDCTDAVLGNRFIRVFYMKRDYYAKSQSNLHTYQNPKQCELLGPIELVSQTMGHSSEDLQNYNVNNVNEFTSLETDHNTIPIYHEDTPSPAVSKCVLKPIISNTNNISKIAIPTNNILANSKHCNNSIRSKKFINNSSNKKMMEQQMALQNKQQSLMENLLNYSKSLCERLEKSTSLSEKEIIKTQLKKLADQINDIKSISEDTLTQTAIIVKNSQEQTNAAPQVPKRIVKDYNSAIKLEGQPPKDLRNIIDRKPRTLLILNINPQENEDLMLHLELFGKVDKLDFDPNKNEMQVTYHTRQEAEKLVHSQYRFKNRNLILKWCPILKPLKVSHQVLNNISRTHYHAFARHQQSLKEAIKLRKSSSNNTIQIFREIPSFADTQTITLDGMQEIDNLSNFPLRKSSSDTPLTAEEVDLDIDISRIAFLGKKTSVVEDSEDDDESEISYWRSRD